jgi:membrane protein
MIMPSSNDRISAPGEPSLGDLFRKLSTDSSQLIRQEIALARTEVASTIGRAGRNAASVAVGLLVMGIGGLVLTGFAIALLGKLLGNYWLGALIVAVVYLAVAGIGMMTALRKARRARLVPEQTVQSLRATQHWAREEVTELRAALTSDDGGAPPAAGNRLAAAHTAITVEQRPSERSGSPGEGAKRGAQNEAPPEPGVWPLAKRTFHEIGSDDVTGQAAKVAYYSFMAMPPALMAVFALAGLFGSDRLATFLLQQASTAMPASVVDSILRPFIQQVVLKSAPGPLSVGIILALWGASSVFTGLMVTLNVAYDVDENRGFVKQRAIALGTMVAATILFLLAALTLLFGPELANLAGLGSAGELAWNILRWPLTFAFVVAAFWIVYYILPNKDQKGCGKVLLISAAVAALLWVLASAVFRLYIANFSSYSKTYGFLGAFIILLLWLYVTGLVVLAGGELASEMEKSR